MIFEQLRAEFGRRSDALMWRASWILLAVSTYVFLAPNVDFASRLTWHDGQRLAELVLVGVIVLAIATSRTGHGVATVWANLSRWIRMALFAAFVLGLVSALQSQLPRWAMLEWGLLLLLLIVALGVAAGRRAGGAHIDRWIIVILYATAVAYVAKMAVVYVAMLTVGATYGIGFNVRELYTGFSNIRFFGQVQTMVLPFLMLPVLWWARSWPQRIGFGVVPVLWWMLAVASGSRGTWVALAIGVFVVLLFGGQTGRRWIKWQITGLVCGLLCYAVFVLLVPLFLEKPATFLHRAGDIISLSLRDVIWTVAINFARENPFLGVGPMHFAYYANAVAAHPHNAVLQFMAEWGIPVALLFTAVFAAGGLAFAGRVRRVVTGPDTQMGMIAVALLASLTGAAAQAMVDGVLVMPVSQILLALIIGWALGLCLADNPLSVQCGTLERTAGAVLIVLAVASVGYGVYPEIAHLEQREEAYLATHSGAPLFPRFWAQGWINQ